MLKICLHVAVLCLVLWSAVGERTYRWSPSDYRWDCVVAISFNDHPVSTGVFISKNIVLTSANPIERYLLRKTRERDETENPNVQFVSEEFEEYFSEYLRIHYVYGSSSSKQNVLCLASPLYGLSVFTHFHDMSRKGCPTYWLGLTNYYSEKGIIEEDHSVLHDLLTLYVESDENFDGADFKQRLLYRHPFIAKTSFKQDIYLEDTDYMFGGFGYLSMLDVSQGTKFEYDVYKTYQPNILMGMFVSPVFASVLRDCNDYFIRSFGNFICIQDLYNVPGVPSGAPLFHKGVLVGIGSFTLTYEGESIHVFTDLRAYFDKAHLNLELGTGFTVCYKPDQAGSFLQMHVKEGLDQVPPLAT